MWWINSDNFTWNIFQKFVAQWRKGNCGPMSMNFPANNIYLTIGTTYTGSCVIAYIDNIKLVFNGFELQNISSVSKSYQQIKTTRGFCYGK